MNTRVALIETINMLKNSQMRLETILESLPKPALGKPQQPDYRQRVERKIWNVWDALKSEREFTPRKAKAIATKDTTSGYGGSISSYSAILSRWHEEGYIERTKEGSGPNPAYYRIPN